MHGDIRNPEKSANNFVKSYKAKKMKSLMKEVAKEIDAIAVKGFTSKQYTSVALDEGSTQKRKILDFCLENPELDVLRRKDETISARLILMKGFEH